MYYMLLLDLHVPEKNSDTKYSYFLYNCFTDADWAHDITNLQFQRATSLKNKLWKLWKESKFKRKWNKKKLRWPNCQKHTKDKLINLFQITTKNISIGELIKEPYEYHASIYLHSLEKLPVKINPTQAFIATKHPQKLKWQTSKKKNGGTNQGTDWKTVIDIWNPL